MKLYVKLLFLVGGGWVGQKKTKLMLYSTLVEIEVELGVELGNSNIVISYIVLRDITSNSNESPWSVMSQC